MFAILAVLAHLAWPSAVQAQTSAGRVEGRVVDSLEAPVVGAVLELRGLSVTAARSARSDSLGRFELRDLPAGRYRLTARRLGYRDAELSAITVDADRPTVVRVVLLPAAAQLGAIAVTAANVQVDPTTPAQVERLERRDIQRLATGRDAASLVGLVPGSRVGAVWGGGGELANNVQLDGIAVGHPGIGGDFLRPSVDWIERLEVRGLGASAEYGDFQGGIINAVTRTGTDRRELTLRTNLEAAGLSASNIDLREEGFEQAARRELSGEAAGPIIPGRLHYFVGGQYLGRDFRVPDLIGGSGFRDVQAELREARGLAKLTWRPVAGRRFDALLGGATAATERAGLTGFDDPSATQRVRAPSVFYELGASFDRGRRNAFDLRLVGFRATETRDGYAGPAVPGVRGIATAREPGFQNADLREQRDPASLALKGTWRTQFATGVLQHRLTSGVEASAGSWRETRLRNGGLTWRPYPDVTTGAFDPADPSTWSATGAQLGGEMSLESRVRSGAVFVQDEIALGSRVTVSPGLRFGSWTGTLRAAGDDPEVSATGLDPRLGLSIDLLGDGTTALKAHWGRYHQGMAAGLFDRLAGASVYSNERVFTNLPRPSSPTFAPTPAEQDVLWRDPTGEPLIPTVKRFDESGRADGYRQPYMDQLVVALERALGPRWKLELVYTQRDNRNIVGLLDRNLATNHTPIRDLAVRERFGRFVTDPNGELLTLPVVWIPNNDLRAALEFMQGRRMPPPPGFSYDTIPTLTWDQDLALTTLPDAQRRFRQAYVALRTEQPRWSAAGSFAWTDLRGNVPGVTASAGQGSGFRAGAWTRPNEALNNDGLLDNFAELEAKMWVAAQLPWGLQGGVTLTHLTGERVTPFFEMESFRYTFRDDHFGGRAFLPEVLQGANGQVIFLEPRGARRYDDRTLLDLRLERRWALRSGALALTAELFNALGEDAATAIKLQVDDNFINEPTTAYGAVRRRVDPRRLRLGMRVEF